MEVAVRKRRMELFPGFVRHMDLRYLSHDINIFPKFFFRQTVGQIDRISNLPVHIPHDRPHSFRRNCHFLWNMFHDLHGYGDPFLYRIGGKFPYALIGPVSCLFVFPQGVPGGMHGYFLRIQEIGNIYGILDLLHRSLSYRPV